MSRLLEAEVEPLLEPLLEPVDTATVASVEVEVRQMGLVPVVR